MISTPAPLIHARGCLSDCIEPSNICCDAVRRLIPQRVRDNLQEFVLPPWYIVLGGRYLRCMLWHLKEDSESISDFASLLYATNCLSRIVIPHLHCRLYNA